MKKPWFKFIATEWLSGKIQLLSPAEKGTYIDLLALIWKENGPIENDKLLSRKLRIDNATACERIETYCDLKIMTLNNGYLSVGFLEDQFIEIAEKSEKNREAALKRWKNKGNECERIQEECERMPIRKEKSRKEIELEKSKSDNDALAVNQSLEIQLCHELVAKVKPYRNAKPVLPEEEWQKFLTHWSAINDFTGKPRWKGENWWNSQARLSGWYSKWYEKLTAAEQIVEDRKREYKPKDQEVEEEDKAKVIAEKPKYERPIEQGIQAPADFSSFVEQLKKNKSL